MKKKLPVVCCCFFVALATLWLFAWPQLVVGECMKPSIQEGRYAFINRIAPYVRTYKINDIITFHYENKQWISRLVALENDTIQIAEGRVIVNDVVADDAKIRRDWNGWKLGTYAIEKSYKVPPKHVYVLSDNMSAEHDDSRIFGPIAHSDIISLVW